MSYSISSVLECWRQRSWCAASISLDRIANSPASAFRFVSSASPPIASLFPSCCAGRLGCTDGWAPDPFSRNCNAPKTTLAVGAVWLFAESLWILMFRIFQQGSSNWRPKPYFSANEHVFDQALQIMVGSVCQHSAR